MTFKVDMSDAVLVRSNRLQNGKRAEIIEINVTVRGSAGEEIWEICVDIAAGDGATGAVRRWYLLEIVVFRFISIESTVL